MMRLRINRIALIQELRVEHVLRSLIEAGILNEDDLKQITSGSTPADKARVLVDMLPGMYVVCIPKSVGLELSDKKLKWLPVKIFVLKMSAHYIYCINSNALQNIFTMETTN